MKLAIPALSSRNFRLFLAGQAVSLLGNSIQQVALVWLIYQMNRSAMILGLMGFVGGLPAAIISSFAGVLADRTNPHRLILATQILFTLQAVLLAGLIYLNHVSVFAIAVLVCLLGIVNGFDTPVRQMFVARLVNRKEDISSAVASNSIVYDVMRILGPALGGFILASYAEKFSFLANGFSHAVVVVLFLFIRLPIKQSDHPREAVLATLVQGVRYAISVDAVRNIILLSACVSFAGSSYMVLTPVMAATVLKGGPHTLGLLLSSVGIGAIIGGLFFSLRRPIAGLAGIISLGAALYGLGLLVFSRSAVPGLSFLALAIAGFGVMVMMAACNTVLLTITDPEKHGRVVSLFALSFMTMSPIGALCTGFLASKVGAPTTIMIGAIICMLAALWFSSHIASIQQLVLAKSGHDDEERQS